MQKSHKNKNGWHMSLLGKVAHGVSSTNLLSAQEGEVNRDWGLAAAPHLLRVYGCGRHPITHPYHFAKPAPMSLDMWHEGHSARWNLQVTRVVLLKAGDNHWHGWILTVVALHLFFYLTFFFFLSSVCVGFLLSFVCLMLRCNRFSQEEV